MPFAVTVVLFVFWLAIAYRELQRGDVMLAVVFLAVGIVLTIYRWRRAMAAQKPAEKHEP
ncbi:MAG: hypothetical protein RL684_1600 [Pseudomonadota bacterium]|jgi:NADH:ubiquinone oxidoreductase subunit 3 (subunit A)